MSVKIMSAVFESQLPETTVKTKSGKTHTVKPSTLKLVLLALADHASDTGEAIYPAIAKVEAKTSLDHTTVIYSVSALKQLEILSVVRKRQKGNIEYRLSSSTLEKFRSCATQLSEVAPLNSTSCATQHESSLTIKEPSKNIAAEKTPAAVIKCFDPDEVDKKVKKTKHLKPEKIHLEPETKGERILFGMIAAEIYATRGPGWKVPKRFPSMACRRMFAEVESKLNGDLKKAINAGLIKGIFAVDNLVKYIHGWKTKDVEGYSSGARVTA